MASKTIRTLPKKKVTKTDFWYCDRCNIDSATNGRRCPCPRGGCEAEVVATTITTVEVIKND